MNTDESLAISRRTPRGASSWRSFSIWALTSLATCTVLVPDWRRTSSAMHGVASSWA